MWPRSAEYLYPGLEPPASNWNENNFDFYYYRVLERITACLETRLGLELPEEVRTTPAKLRRLWRLQPSFSPAIWVAMSKAGCGCLIRDQRMLPKLTGLMR